MADIGDEGRHRRRRRSRRGGGGGGGGGRRRHRGRHPHHHRGSFILDGKKKMHRPGIEPGPPAVCYPLEWQASILPLNHRCDVLREGIFSYIFVYIWKSDFFIKKFLCVKNS